MTDYGPVRGHKYLAWIETADTLVVIDTGYDVAWGEPFEGSDVDTLIKASMTTGKPVSHILLTHDHPDHVANLPLLREQWPAAQVGAHPNSQLTERTLSLDEGQTLQVGGETFHVLHTPGHSSHRDELSFYLPRHRFLFPGDLAQPQGPSYEYANGPSPVPFFHDGNAYYRSLERLLALDVQHIRTGHGDLLGPEQAKQWLRVTLATLLRIQELAIEFVERYPTRDAAWLAEAVYDQIADERRFGLRRANQRKRRDEATGTSDYERYDQPGLLAMVEEARR